MTRAEDGIWRNVKSGGDQYGEEDRLSVSTTVEVTLQACNPSSESERGPGKVVNRRIQCQGELAAIAEQYHCGTPHTVTPLVDLSSASAVDPLTLTSTTTTVLDNCSSVLCPYPSLCLRDSLECFSQIAVIFFILPFTDHSSMSRLRAVLDELTD